MPAPPCGCRMSEKTRAALILLLLSPMIGEMLSGSSPPLEFFHPFSLALLLGMYGTGALLVRELAVIWRKGWASILSLGASYGIIEEGIAVKSFFDPGWQDLGTLAEYGRYVDVNWVWAFWLTVYHSSVSIALPILIIGLLFPRTKGERLLSRRALHIVAAVFVADIVFCIPVFADLQGYFPPPAQYAGAFLASALLIWFAWKVPGDLVRARTPRPVWPARRFVILGAGFVLASFVISGSAPESVPPVVMILLLLAVCAAVLFLLQGRLGEAGNARHRACFALGMMAFFIVLAPIQEIFNGMTGMTAVGVAFALFAVYLVRQATRLENKLT